MTILPAIEMRILPAIEKAAISYVRVKGDATHTILQQGKIKAKAHKAAAQRRVKMKHRMKTMLCTNLERAVVVRMKVGKSALKARKALLEAGKKTTQKIPEKRALAVKSAHQEEETAPLEKEMRSMTRTIETSAPLIGKAEEVAAATLEKEMWSKTRTIETSAPLIGKAEEVEAVPRKERIMKKSKKITCSLKHKISAVTRWAVQTDLKPIIGAPAVHNLLEGENL